jgi:hypothetical protein
VVTNLLHGADAPCSSVFEHFYPVRTRILMDSIFQRIIFPAARLALCICFALSVISPSKAAASDAISKKENNYRAVQRAKGQV